MTHSLLFNFNNLPSLSPIYMKLKNDDNNIYQYTISDEDMKSKVTLWEKNYKLPHLEELRVIIKSFQKKFENT